MNKLLKLRAELDTHIQAMRSIVDTADQATRDMTADETASYDALIAKVTTTKAAIKREEDLAAMESTMSASLPRQAAPNPVDAPRIDATFSRYSKLKAFTAPIVIDGREISANESAYRSGMWIQAALFGDAKSAQWCRDHGIAIQAAASEGVNTKGGFLVPTEFSQAIIDLREVYGVFRQNTRVVPMARDTMTVPRRTSGLTAYFVGENAEITASDKAWDQVSLTAKKMGALAKFSSELAEDAVINLADDLATEIGYAFATKEDACGFNGDGSTTYGGIVGVRAKLVDGNHAAGAIDTVTANADTFAELAALDLHTMMSALPQYAIPNAKFYCSQTAWAMVFERILSATGGNTSSLMTGAVNKSFLGYPVVITQSMPTSTGTLDNVAMILFGDLSMASTMGDRRGMSLMVSDHRYMELDQMAIRGTTRMDINVHDLGDGTTAGPIVGLIGKA